MKGFRTICWKCEEPIDILGASYCRKCFKVILKDNNLFWCKLYRDPKYSDRANFGDGPEAIAEEMWQDIDRCWIEVERVYETRWDCSTERLKAA